MKYNRFTVYQRGNGYSDTYYIFVLTLVDGSEQIYEIKKHQFFRREHQFFRALVRGIGKDADKVTEKLKEKFEYLQKVDTLSKEGDAAMTYTTEGATVDKNDTRRAAYSAMAFLEDESRLAQMQATKAAAGSKSGTYTVTYACGHTIKERIEGTPEEREWAVQRRLTEKCPECERKEREAIEAENARQKAEREEAERIAEEKHKKEVAEHAAKTEWSVKHVEKHCNIQFGKEKLTEEKYQIQLVYRVAEPNEEFWSYWKDYKQEIKGTGIRVVKVDGKYEVRDYSDKANIKAFEEIDKAYEQDRICDLAGELEEYIWKIEGREHDRLMSRLEGCETYGDYYALAKSLGWRE